MLVKIGSDVSVDSILSYCHNDLLIDDMDWILAPFLLAHDTGGADILLGAASEKDPHACPEFRMALRSS
jgi:hypothetical protein